MTAKSKTRLAVILKILYLPIFLVSLVCIGWFMYYQVVLKDSVNVIHTNFVDSGTYAEDDTYFMELNIFGDCVEWKFNYYIDTNMPAKNEDGTFDRKYVMSTGVQLYNLEDIGEIWKNNHFFTNYLQYKTNLHNCTYYTTPDGLSYGYKSSPETCLANQDKWIWDVGGKLYLIRSVGDVWLDQFLWKNFYIDYDVNLLIYQNIASFRSLKNGTTITMFDFSPYFTLSEYDETTGRFKDEIVDTNVLTEWTYVNVKVNKTDRNIVDAKQSIFGAYKGDTEWNAYGNGEKDKYWQSYTIKTLTENDFMPTEIGGQLTLKSSAKDFYEKFDDTKYVIDINLDAFEGLDLTGLKKDCLKGFDIKELKLKASKETTFTLENDFEKITTENVTVVKGG